MDSLEQFVGMGNNLATDLFKKIEQLKVNLNDEDRAHLDKEIAKATKEMKSATDGFSKASELLNNLNK